MQIAMQAIGLLLQQDQMVVATDPDIWFLGAFYFIFFLIWKYIRIWDRTFSTLMSLNKKCKFLYHDDCTLNQPNLKTAAEQLTNHSNGDLYIKSAPY